jgi:2-C-methyl-D-erythritol 4-phosphate cytidylyltransferase
MGRRIRRVGAVVAAGGSGSRFGGKVPKQFVSLGGKSLLRRSLETLESVSVIDAIVVVVPERYLVRARREVRNARLKKIAGVVSGGTTRQASVLRGLRAFTDPPDVVLVHDAVRPLMTRALAERVVREAMRWNAAVPALRVNDTMKVEGKRRFVTGTVDRSGLWTVQTPQGFHYPLLLEAHIRAEREHFGATDDAALVERMAVPIRLVEGEVRNIKVTSREDVGLAELILKERRTRGSG